MVSNFKVQYLETEDVIKDIAEACNSSLEEFFYYKISEYKNDTMLIEKFKALSQEKKDALLTLLS